MPQFVRELREQRDVGGGEVVGAEPGLGGPGEGGVLVGVGRGAVGGKTAEERQHVNDHGAVVEVVGRKRADDLDVAGELFADLAQERGGRLLVDLDLAAGEFPFQAEVFVRRALREQDATGGVGDDRADNWDGAGR